MMQKACLQAGLALLAAVTLWWTAMRTAQSLARLQVNRLEQVAQWEGQ